MSHGSQRLLTVALGLLIATTPIWAADESSSSAPLPAEYDRLIARLVEQIDAANQANNPTRAAELERTLHRVESGNASPEELASIGHGPVDNAAGPNGAPTPFLGDWPTPLSDHTTAPHDAAANGEPPQAGIAPEDTSPMIDPSVTTLRSDNATTDQIHQAIELMQQTDPDQAKQMAQEFELMAIERQHVQHPDAHLSTLRESGQDAMPDQSTAEPLTDPAGSFRERQSDLLQQPPALRHEAVEQLVPEQTKGQDVDRKDEAAHDGALSPWTDDAGGTPTHRKLSNPLEPRVEEHSDAELPKQR